MGSGGTVHDHDGDGKADHAAEDHDHAEHDHDGDGKAEQVKQIAAGFKTPHGIALQGGQIYIGDTQAVWRAAYQGKDSLAASDFTRLTKAPDLPVQMLAAGLNAVKGDTSKKDALYAAMKKAQIDSPRGKFTLSPQHNPTQDFYVREVKGNYNVVTGVAVKALADPGRGCKM